MSVRGLIKRSTHSCIPLCTHNIHRPMGLQNSSSLGIEIPKIRHLIVNGAFRVLFSKGPHGCVLEVSSVSLCTWELARLNWCGRVNTSIEGERADPSKKCVAVQYIAAHPCEQTSRPTKKVAFSRSELNGEWRGDRRTTFEVIQNIRTNNPNRSRFVANN